MILLAGQASDSFNWGQVAVVLIAIGAIIYFAWWATR